MRIPVLAVCSLSLPLLGGRVPLKDQSLRWTPTTQIAELELGTINLLPFEGKTFEIIPFTDSRPDPSLVGENREKEDKGEVLPVHVKDKVGAFVTTRARAFFKELGLPVVDAPSRIQVTGDIQSFLATEANTYSADVRFRVTLKVEGKAVWSGLVIGSARRFGRSYKMENYNEVLSDALLNALAGMIRNPEFMKALGQAK